jgi:hypothetical protein
LFAITVVLLLLMVAFAVDLGATAEQRREVQSAADAASLASAQQLGRTNAKFASGSHRTAALLAAEAVAREYVESNTGLAAGDPAWASCSDASALAVRSQGTECISFSSDATQVRVRVPDRDVAFRFARVAGLESGTVRASAVAEVTSALGNSTRPILLRAGNFGRRCIEGGGNNPECPANPPALGPGDFGSMTSPRYRHVTAGTDDVNFALGLDHYLKLTSTNGINYCDSAGSPPHGNNGDANRCSNQANGLLNNTPQTHDLANYVFVDQGGQLKDVTEGLLGLRPNQRPAGCPTTVNCLRAGGDTITALLYRPDGARPDELVPAAGPAGPLMGPYFGRDNFNGVHISRYLNQSGRTATGCSATDHQTRSLDRSEFDGCNDRLSQHIVANAANPTPIFSPEIASSPRFGVAPATSMELRGNSLVAPIVDFYGIYLDRLHGNNNQVKAIIAFVFPLAMIEPIPGQPGGGLPFVGGPFAVRLIR